MLLKSGVWSFSFSELIEELVAICFVSHLVLKLLVLALGRMSSSLLSAPQISSDKKK